MKFRIQKVTVLGSGIMGSGIACHLANIGIKVLMLDIPPKSDNDKSNNKNIIADQALKKAVTSKPAALYDKSFVNKISTGNFEDDFEKINDSDWIIEVVVEKLEIKKQIFEKVEKYRKKGSLITSNTSSIPISILSEGRSDDFKKYFCGTHFFNPPRYMRLLEIIPAKESSTEMINFFMEFGSNLLGKQTVLCKDTPAFIANRIGVVSGTELILLADKYNMGAEETDAMTGSLIGRPNTATFRLQDLVGLDTSDNVSSFIQNNVKEDSYLEKLKNHKGPKFMRYLLDNKYLGNKTGKGFYEKTNTKDNNGKTIINVLNFETLEYEPCKKPKLDIVKSAKSIELMDKRLKSLIEGESKENLFFKEYFSILLSYSANRVPEIADQFYQIDDAMRAGYFWDYGPFEYWDLIGLSKGIELIKKSEEKIPKWIELLEKSGAKSFYKFENGKRKYFNINSKKYETIPGSKKLIILNSLRENTPVIKNSECTVHDIGDGVMCLEFLSKSNSIGEGIGRGLIESIQKAEEEDWNGVLIGNNAKQFSVGANLMNIGMMAMQKQFKPLEELVNNFQQIMMKIKTSKIPVVTAAQGYVFGGGCEIAMHSDAGIYASESYIGLVEVGVGLLPGGGGTKEFALRASDDFFEGDVKTPTLINYFKTIATATVSTSAHEGYNLNYLKKNKDFICMNIPMNIGMAKDKVLELAKNYIAPTERKDIEVLGRGGLSVLYSAINEFRLGEYMSDYDVVIAKKVAEVICGGDLTSPQKVSEQYLLDIEREAFMSLLGNQKTLERIQYLLMNNKPLRN